MRGSEKFSLRDIVEFEAVVTMEFSEMYDLPIASVCDLFQEHGVYGYLEDEMDLLVTKNARFISENVTEVFGFQLEKVQPSESRKVPPPTPGTGERSKVEHSEVRMMSVIVTNIERKRNLPTLIIKKSHQHNNARPRRY